MELIEITGYLIEEKLEIAKRHLFPKQLENHGVKPDQISIDNKVMEMLIEKYTRESGVRELDKRLAKIVRVTAKNIASETKYDSCSYSKDSWVKCSVLQNIQEIFIQEMNRQGLLQVWPGQLQEERFYLWKPVLAEGTGKLTLTGNLGEVMKESAVIALEYLKSNAELLDLPDNFSEKWNIHIHVPEGAIPKDGPSAGITMATSIASAFTQRKVKKYHGNDRGNYTQRKSSSCWWDQGKNSCSKDEPVLRKLLFQRKTGKMLKISRKYI